MTKEKVSKIELLLSEMAEALRPFATAKMCSTDGDPVADWARQHESEGIELIWDPENSRAPLTIGQFKRAKAAYTKAKELIDAADAAPQAILPFAHEPAEAEPLGEPDWWYRDLDPDECGYSPHEALRWTRDYRVDMLHSSHRGPTKFAFRAPVIGDPDEDEVLLFDTEEEALAAAEERRAALRLKGGGRP